jgi:hypothetical protein
MVLNPLYILLFEDAFRAIGSRCSMYIIVGKHMNLAGTALTAHVSQDKLQTRADGLALGLLSSEI